MDKQLFIPSKIAVGFQNRDDTYTKKLAYVVYYDLKGVRRKEKSWESWRNKKIASIDFDNVPTEGFVLNKGVGGARQSYGWNCRNEYIRVYDPRDFEFEISVSNLLFILRECDCSRGKGLEGKFVYAWDGTELVLLPECSSDYQNSKNYTALQDQGVKAKDMIAGASYQTKKQEILIYPGKFDYHFISTSNSSHNARCKKHVFWDTKAKGGNQGFVFLNDLKTIAVLNSDTVVENYAELVAKYNKSANGSKIVKLFTKPYIPPKNPKNNWWSDYWVNENPDGTYTEACTHYRNNDQIHYITTTHLISFTNGVLTFKSNHGQAFHPNTVPNYSSYSTTVPWIEPTNLHLWAELESGANFRIQNGSFYQKGD